MMIDAQALRKHLEAQLNVVANNAQSVFDAGATSQVHVNTILRDHAVAHSLYHVIKAIDAVIAESENP